MPVDSPPATERLRRPPRAGNVPLRLRRPPRAGNVPEWLRHPLRAQTGPVPWSAMARGAASVLPLLAAVLAGAPTAGVPAAVAALFAGINDRPGSRRGAPAALGLPAAAGACGLLAGTLVGAAVPQELATPVLPLFLGLLGLVAGALSSTGATASACGTQLLIAAVIGVGMDLPEPVWLSCLSYLSGAAWPLLLRRLVPSPRRRGRITYRLDGECEALAAVYERVAALLEAVGSPAAGARRAALTAALDHAQDALAGTRTGPRASRAERGLRARYDAAAALAEAATALAWKGEPVPERAVHGTLRLAAAARTGAPCGPLPAPPRTASGLRALDDALLRAAEAFDAPGRGPVRARTGRRASWAGHLPAADAVRRGTATAVPGGAAAALRRAAGPAGREYGARVGLCCAASAALALALGQAHWYWLPATAVFLVKPDLGPLVSRVVCRALGTVLGAVLCALLLLSGPGPQVLTAAVAVCGALVPYATRHFAAQTAVVTVLVLCLVALAGEPPATGERVVQSLLACATVLVVGHLPLPGRHGNAVRHRLDDAADAARRYLEHVLTEPGDRTGRWALRRRAYRAAAAAQQAAGLSAAELPPIARHSEGAWQVATGLVGLLDAITATAVDADDRGAPVCRRDAERLGARLAELTGLLREFRAGG